MSFELETNEPVVDGFRRVATEQIDKALASIDEAEPHEAVHDVRKRCKKVRGLCRLVRGSFAGYSEANEHFRDTARLLSDLRDATAMLETFDELVNRRGEALDDDAVGTVRELLRERRERLSDRDGLAERLGEARRRLVESRSHVGDWSLDDDGFDAIAKGLAKTYHRARERAFEAGDARDDDELFHEWRKRVKYHRYHMDLLAPIWPEVLEAREDLCHRLTDSLGDDHDLVVLRACLNEQRELTPLIAVVDGLGRRRSQKLRAASVHLGRWLYVDELEAFVSRIEAWWRAARD